MSTKGNHEKQQDNLQERLVAAELRFKGTCMHPGCTNKVNMKSHVLQKEGVLRHIAPDGKIREITEGRLLYPTCVEKEGISNSKRFAFYGLCGIHDNKDFAELEKANADKDFLSYRQHLLFSYRSVLNDLSLGRAMARYHIKAINNSGIDLTRRKELQRVAPKYIIASKELEHFKFIIERELWFNDPTQHFYFHRRVLPKVEVATSALFGESHFPYYITPQLPWGLTYGQAMGLDPASKHFKPHTAVTFLHIIPQESNTIVLLGYIKSATEVRGCPVDSIASMSDADFLKLCSDVLITIQTWCMSENLYQTWQAQGIIEGMLTARNYFLENAYRPTGQKLEKVTFNMFESV